MTAPTREQVDTLIREAGIACVADLCTGVRELARLAFAAGTASRPVPTGADVLTEEECRELIAQQYVPDGVLFSQSVRMMLQRAARIGAERERERAARVAMDHECGGEDDITCRGQNCGMCIAAAIRRGEG